MTLIAKFTLFCQAYWAMIHAKIKVTLLPSHKLVRHLGVAQASTVMQTLVAQDTLTIKRIVKAIKLSQKLLPFHCSCLVLAMATQQLLEHAQQPYELYLGLHKEHGELAAHAWITSQGLAVIGAPQEDEFTPIAQFTPKNQNAD